VHLVIFDQGLMVRPRGRAKAAKVFPYMLWLVPPHCCQVQALQPSGGNSAQSGGKTVGDVRGKPGAGKKGDIGAVPFRNVHDVLLLDR